MKKFLSAIAWMLASAAGAAHGGSVVFGAPANIATDLRPGGIVVGDFNNDGKEDIAVTNFGDNNISVLIGNGDGTFAPAKAYAVGTLPRFVAIADIDGDGALDLAVTSNGSNSVAVLKGNGQGVFGNAITFATGATPNDVRAANLNGDGSR